MTSVSNFTEKVFAGTAPGGESPWAWVKSLLLAGLITGVGLLLNLRAAPANVAMLYLAAVVFTALRWGLRPAVFVSVISTLLFDQFFIDPYMSFTVTDAWYVITLVAMTGTGILISLLAGSARRQMLAAREREAQTAALYSLTRSLGAAWTAEQALHTAGSHIQETFGRPVAIFLRGENKQVLLRYQTPESDVGEDTIRAAGSVLQQSIDSTWQSERLFVPLRIGARATGILVLLPANSSQQMTHGEERVLVGMANQLALAIKRASLQKEAREAEVLRKADELQRTLLNSVSHSLRAPLAAILSALDPIADSEVRPGSAATAELARIAQGEAHRLDGIIGNLLDLSRLEGGILKIRSEPHDLQNIIGTAISEVRKWQDRPIDSAIDPRIPPLPVDFVLVVHVLENLIDNAMKYSPPAAPVRLEARVVDSSVEIRVLDRGCGIPSPERDRMFQKFYRGERTHDKPGIGLGLAICKGFIEAHHGRIWVEDREGGGSAFCFRLPLQNHPNPSNVWLRGGSVQRRKPEVGSSL